MGFRFWRRIRVAPGVTLNLSKTGGSLSFGTRGANLTLGRRGAQGTVGIPGSGLFYTKRVGAGSGGKGGGTPGRGTRTHAGAPGGRERGSGEQESGQRAISRSHFRWKWLGAGGKHLAEAIVLWSEGREAEATEHALAAPELPDARFFGGMLLLRAGRHADAEREFKEALRSHAEVGRWFKRLKLTLGIEFPVTDALYVDLPLRREGVELALVEALQGQGKISEAVGIVRGLQTAHPADPVIRISLGDLLLDEAHSKKVTKSELEEVARFPDLGDSRSQVDTVMVMLKAGALQRLGLSAPSLRMLSGLLRRKSGLSEELRTAVLFERALVYALRGEARKSRSDLEEVYARDPDFRDVRARLGLSSESSAGEIR